MIGVVFTSSIYLAIFISGAAISNFGVACIFNYIPIYILSLLLLSCYIEAPSNELNKSTEIAPYSLLLNAGNFFNLRLICYSLVLSISTIIAYCYAFYAPLISFSLYGVSPSEFGRLNLINMIFILSGSLSYIKFKNLYQDDFVLLSCLAAVLLIGCVFFIMSQVVLLNNISVFFALSCLLNFFSGLIYPVATYKALDCGHCKTASATTMNVIKLGMPTIALYFASIFRLNCLLSLSITIMFFSFIYLMVFLNSHFRGTGLLA